MSERREPKPPAEAVALRYDPQARDAPDVVAKGRGEVAERILALADEHGVPVRRDTDLLQLLSVCDVGDEIPAELYAAVAELLAYLYRLNGELGESSSR
ncbi:MAG: EscU/YscU/HrcU family type III secretion system export apparatus switch protein [Planctomycetota bacterium]